MTKRKLRLTKYSEEEISEIVDEVFNGTYEEYLEHYGMPRRSGRYPWGSGDNPYQHSSDFIARIMMLRQKGLTEKQIAETMLGEGASTSDLRGYETIAKNERRKLIADRARSLRDDGLSLNQIKDKLNEEFDGTPGYKHKNNDSSIRSLLNEDIAENKDRYQKTADVLRKELETKRMVDVGAGVELYLNVSENTLETALKMLENEGYHVYGGRMDQVTNPKSNRKTTLKVLARPDVPYKDIYQNIGDIQEVGQFTSNDGGDTWTSIKYPASIDSNRVSILYGDQGGRDKDGVIELRRGVADLSLGDANYAQVRILVDGTHYLKGMAMYSDNMPDGYDIVFNTNKASGTPKEKVMKKIKDDPNNPFGALIKAKGQSEYLGEDGEMHLSAINKLKEEGDWDKMAKTLSSQFLSKQPVPLIRSQLDKTYKDKVLELAELKELNNSAVKKQLLEDFADQCDGAAVHLKAAALPRQKTQVILPITDLKENEIYAPNFRDGETVSLVRYPHAGTFEIPQLKVNNKNKSAISILGTDVTDAVGINPAVAERLSGADFDGDTVVVIPTNSRVKIKSTKALDGLKGFDAKIEYSSTLYEDDEKGHTFKDSKGKTQHYAVNDKTGQKFKPMTSAQTQQEMGKISNLINDMTLAGATEDELARAVRHSQVVIDAEKHCLDFRQSEKDNGIAALKKRYQTTIKEDGTEHVGGAATLLSKRKQEVDVPERQGQAIIDKDTGKVSYKESGRTYVDKATGETVLAKEKDKLILMTEDVTTLSSGTPQENLYAQYANNMKALSNEARKEMVNTKTDTVSPTQKAEAKTKYAKEVAELDAALQIAKMNAPKERRAQIIANAKVKAQIEDNPDLKDDKDALKKARQLAITDARLQTGASGKKSKIDITDAQWEAIQAGAISSSKQSEIFKNCDSTRLKQLATPKSNGLTTTQINRIQNFKSAGYTNQEIADALGLSVSTVIKYSKGDK